MQYVDMQVWCCVCLCVLHNAVCWAAGQVLCLPVLHMLVCRSGGVSALAA